MANRARRAWAAASQAKQESKALGVLTPVDPAQRRSDGSPKVGPGQVYAVSSGKVFHPAWCNSVGNVWDENPKRLLVVMESAVGDRKACKACDEPLQA